MGKSMNTATAQARGSLKTKDITGIVARSTTNTVSPPYWSDFMSEMLGKIRSGGKPKPEAYPAAAVIQYVQRGLKPKAVTNLQEALDITKGDTYELLGIPHTTFNRRIKEGRLKPEESDRVFRFAWLLSQAIAMMQGDRDSAIRWFKTEQEIFGGNTPMQQATSELGAREVENLIGRIRHGVFS